MLLDPKFWLAVVISAIALFGSGYWWGNKHASAECTADQVHAQQAAQAGIDETNTRREEVANKRETSREQIRVVYRTIKEKADGYREKISAGLHSAGAASPVAGCGLDADGVRLWNAANAGNTAPLLGKLDYRLSSAATGQVGQVDGFAGQPYRGDGAVQPVPRPAEETGGVREGEQ